MRVLDLFSGIGGFSLGLERAGMETVAFCEIEKYPQKVLAKHWPDVPIYEDVRNVTKARLESDGITGIDIVTGGFPCQDLSVAGKQAGIHAERSGLWGELCRIIGDIRPKYAIVENVTALISGDSGRWFGRVLGDLAEIGYDCEWHCIPASELGAHHHRDRVWIICYPQHTGQLAAEVREGYHAGNGSNQEGQKSASESARPGNAEVLAHPNSQRLEELQSPTEPNNQGEPGRGFVEREGGGQAEILADSNDNRSQNKRRPTEFREQKDSPIGGGGADVADTSRQRQQGSGKPVEPILAEAIKNWKAVDAESGCISGIWAVESELGRVANGIPDRSHRLKGLGNAVVPQIPELIGRAIMEIERA